MMFVVVGFSLAFLKPAQQIHRVLLSHDPYSVLQDSTGPLVALRIGALERTRLSLSSRQLQKSDNSSVEVHPQA
jgi:hypothetical protein